MTSKVVYGGGAANIKFDEEMGNVFPYGLRLEPTWLGKPISKKKIMGTMIVTWSDRPITGKYRWR